MARAEKTRLRDQGRESPVKASEERVFKRHPQLDSFGFEGPWTEQDDIWLEIVTGEPQGRHAARDLDL
jgi:hypothetical protein